MKRSFIIIGGVKPHEPNPVLKQIFESLPDSFIDTLYSKYSKIDGKHTAFKGTKREYCMTVAKLIFNFLDKTKTLDNNLTGGKRTAAEKAAAVKAAADAKAAKAAAKAAEKLKKENAAADAKAAKAAAKAAKEQQKIEGQLPFKSKIPVLKQEIKDLELAVSKTRGKNRVANQALLREKKTEEAELFINERLGLDKVSLKDKAFLVRPTVQHPETREYYPKAVQVKTGNFIDDIFAADITNPTIKKLFTSEKGDKYLPSTTSVIPDWFLNNVKERLLEQYETYYNVIENFEGNWSAETTFLITAAFPSIISLEADGQPAREKFVLKVSSFSQGLDKTWTDVNEANFRTEVELLSKILKVVDKAYYKMSEAEIRFFALNKIFSKELGFTQVDFSSNNLDVELKGNVVAGKEDKAVLNVDTSKVAMMILKSFKDPNSTSPLEFPRSSHVSFCLYENNAQVNKVSKKDDSVSGILAYIDWDLNKIITDPAVKIYLNALLPEITEFCKTKETKAQGEIAQKATGKVLNLILAHYGRAGNSTGLAALKPQPKFKDDTLLSVPVAIKDKTDVFRKDMALVAYDPSYLKNIQEQEGLPTLPPANLTNFLDWFTNKDYSKFRLNRDLSGIGTEPVVTVPESELKGIYRDTPTKDIEIKLSPLSENEENALVKEHKFLGLDPLDAAVLAFNDPVTSSGKDLDASLIEEWKKEFEEDKKADEKKWGKTAKYTDMTVGIDGTAWDIEDINTWDEKTKRKILKYLKSLTGHGKPNERVSSKKAYKKKVIKYY